MTCQIARKMGSGSPLASICLCPKASSVTHSPHLCYPRERARAWAHEHECIVSLRASHVMWPMVARERNRPKRSELGHSSHLPHRTPVRLGLSG